MEAIILCFMGVLSLFLLIPWLLIISIPILFLMFVILELPVLFIIFFRSLKENVVLPNDPGHHKAFFFLNTKKIKRANKTLARDKNIEISA